MRKLFLVSVLVIFVVTVAQWTTAEANRTDKDCIYTGEYRDVWDNNFPLGYNSMFTGSGECIECHGKGHGANEDSTGMNVSPGKYWGATMMANAGRDPYWLAKVSHETMVLPQHSVEIEHTCSKCHAPQGHFRALEDGATFYAIADMDGDSLAQDGVSCTACHGIEPLAGPPVFSGTLDYLPNFTVYGPYPDPDTLTMWNHINTVPEHSNHVLDSELCGRCHSLITASFDLNGNPTGTDFVEQAIYHEWLNSDFSTLNKECQSCHLPQIEDSIILAVEPNYILPRSPYGKHHLVGGNAFMLKIFKNNPDTLGVLAEPVQFDTTIALTEQQLRYKTLDIELLETNRTSDTAFYDLKLTNLAGHKFPAGYPSRRAFVQFVVLNNEFDTIFASGVLDDDFEVIGHDASYEPHHNYISAEDQVQIYEMVMGNINGDFTTVLTQAVDQLKDNRIAPTGFSATHNAWDTVKIVGNALADPDFNWDGSTEGTGADIVHYHVPINGYTDDIIVHARVYYQAIPPRWVSGLPTGGTPEIQLFESLYAAADKTPSLVAEAGINEYLSISEMPEPEIKMYPNPARNGQTYLELPLNVRAKTINLYSAFGQLLATVDPKKQQRIPVILPLEGQVFIVEVILEDGRHWARTILKQSNA